MGIVLQEPSTKRPKVSKHYVGDFQSFIELTIWTNMCGELRNATFFIKFRQIILVLMEL